MLRNLKVSVLAVPCLTLLLSLSAAISAQSPQPAKSTGKTATAKFYRTEVYFGRAKPDGTIVADPEWKGFLDEIVTPRFPDGFTVLQAIGQYREKSGRIIVEPSLVLIVVYSVDSKKESRAKIEEIRTAYLKRFDQESVLRIDLPKSVRVSF
jgi:Protein of unknown function (DUF3574)